MSESWADRKGRALPFLMVLVGVLFPLGAGTFTLATTTLVSSPNPATLGQAVTLTAAVSPPAASGKVTFYDGVTVLGVSTISGGQATLITKLLPSGSRSLRAYYAGDASFAPSASATVAQTVFAWPQNGFQTAVSYNAGSAPWFVAVGDFNGDGKADLAVANEGAVNSQTGNVSILLGNGDGTFQAAVNCSVGPVPYSIAVGDFNGDGKVDLAVANASSGNVSVLLGNGDGTFQAAVNYSAGGLGPHSIVTADFNGDGNVDLAVASPLSGVGVLLGNGDGTFRAPVSYNVGSFAQAIAAGDFNGDGKADLAVANRDTNNLSVLIGNGDGTFQGAVNYNVGTAPIAVAVGDFNGDGRADLAVANNASNDVSVLLGNGDGTFRATVSYGGFPSPFSVTVGDFNGDGTPDLAVGGTSLSILIGNGDGTFQQNVTYNAAVTPRYPAVGDFNGDGISDLAVANSGSTNNVSILLGQRASTPPKPSINAGGVVTAANYATQLASGEIATLFGANLSSGAAGANNVRLPTELGGLSVSANGILAPLFFVSPAQVNFQIPWELLGQSQASIVATVNGSASAPQTITLRAVSPGIFSIDSSGSRQGAIQIANTAIFAAPAGSIPGASARPATRGEFLTIYCSGLGDAFSRPATGAPASSSPVSNTMLTASATIGGVAAPVSFAGLSPGFVGLYQVNVQVPDAAPTGPQVPVAITIGGVSSNMVTIAVQ